MWNFSRLAAGYALLVGLAACGGSGGSSPSDKRDPFIAVATDFFGYHSWQSYDVTKDAALVGIHDGSTVIEYINQLPPTESKEFPVGTRIVKEATGGTIAHELFAMCKRGGGFNVNAPGWEWFELENLPTGNDRVKIKWHGFGPPKGEVYGGDPNAGCNKCHTDCNNDQVCAKALALTNF
jgi:hypothetical protein